MLILYVKKLGLAVTITPLNQNVDLIYDHLYQLPNVDCVSMRFIRNYDGSKYDFDNFDVPYLISRYEKLCTNILRELEEGNFDYLKKLIQGADYFGGLIYGNLFKGTYKIYRCDAGKSRITVDNTGDIFACSVMYGNKDFRIGSIYSGINKKCQSKFKYVSIERETQCQNCKIKSICGGECYVNTYSKYYSFYKPINQICNLKIELNKLSVAFISLLKSKYFDIYRLFVNYAFVVNGYESAQIEIWIIMCYLKEQNIYVDYQDVFDAISSYGNIIEGIINYIKKYKSEVAIYKMSADDNIKVPAIAIVNKRKSNQINFLFIKESINGNIVCHDFYVNNDEYFKIPFIEFINNISDIIIC